MNIVISETFRIEPAPDKVFRMLGAGKEATHWQVVAELDGPVEVYNLLKFNTGLKLYVEAIDGNKIFLSTIRKIKDLGNLRTCDVRMKHWKYGRTNG